MSYKLPTSALINLAPMGARHLSRHSFWLSFVRSWRTFSIELRKEACLDN